MEILALTGISAHSCGENRYWWIIPALLIAAIAVRAIYRHVSDKRDERRYADRIRQAERAARLDNYNRF